jgi:hypothetical protein
MSTSTQIYMETESFHPPPLSSDDETDDGSDSFEEWQLIGAETENTELMLAMEGLCISGEARPGHTIYVAGYSFNGTVRCDFAVCSQTQLIYLPSCNYWGNDANLAEIKCTYRFDW